ncbi:MAG: T9SS type A sorting domain-containing protein [Bacteroidia bacterium]
MKNKFYTLTAKGFLCGTILLFNSMATFAQSPSWLWAESAGGINDDAGYSIAVNVNGNCYVTGYFRSNTITFGSTTLTNSNNGSLFVVKYDPLGNVLWAKQAENGYGFSIAVDTNGYSYVTGAFEGTSIVFGSTTLLNTSISLNDIFIVKYDPSGNVVWAKSASGNNIENASSISVNPAGNSYITGNFVSDSITFDNITLINGNPGYDLIFITKYDASGNVVWAKSPVGTDNAAYSIKTDVSGNSYLTGYFRNAPITFGSFTLLPVGSFDIFLVKYDSSGNVLWANRAAGTSLDFGLGVTVDANGNSYMTGSFISPTLDFGSTALTFTGGVGGDAFIAKYDVSGNVLWAKSAVGLSDDHGYAITADANGNCYVTGSFLSTTITFGSITLTNGGNTDIFIAKYDSLGNAVWAKSAGGNNADVGYGIITDVNENLHITGIYRSPSITFGTSTLTNADNSGLTTDIFVAKLDSFITTGIAEENNSFNEINLFPNPGNGKINITSSDIIEEIKITNPLGQIIYRANPNEKDISVHIDNDGIYFVIIKADKLTTTRKVIVQY